MDNKTMEERLLDDIKSTDDKTAQNSADIAYISMETGVDL